MAAGAIAVLVVGNQGEARKGDGGELTAEEKGRKEQAVKVFVSAGWGIPWRRRWILWRRLTKGN